MRGYGTRVIDKSRAKLSWIAIEPSLARQCWLLIEQQLPHTHEGMSRRVPVMVMQGYRAAIWEHYA